jgi:PPK2 family polyphosphate:nucleotide phosphotransferase
MPYIQLSTLDTCPPKDLDKDACKAKTETYLEEIAELQNRLYASQHTGLLIILQGMDGSGKDGAIKKVFTHVNPMGIKVFSFKKPTDEEFAHDFLWRIHKVCPDKGMIHIFNRSHYEDILIQRVHKWIDNETVQRRKESINDFEKHLSRNGTVILKFYLHISKEEQLERLEERKTNPEKMWKYNADDMKERALWDDYMLAYEDAIDNCSKYSEWQVIPADKNWYKEYLISKAVHKALTDMELEYPKLT